MRKKVLITLILLISVTVLGLFLFQKQDKTVKQSPTKLIENQTGKSQEKEKAPVKNKDQASTPLFYRFIPEPPQMEMVRFELSGRLEGGKMLKSGDSFSKNDLLFQLDNSAVFAEISRKKTELKAKVEGLYEQFARETPETYARWQAYSQAVTETDLLPPFPDDLSTRERTIINPAGILPLSLQIAQKEQEIFRYFYLAPFDGRVGRIFTTPGKTIRAGQAVAEIYSGEYYLAGKIHKRDLAKFSGKQVFETGNGQEISLSFKAGKQHNDSIYLRAMVPYPQQKQLASEALFLRSKN